MKDSGETTEHYRDSGALSSPLSFRRSGYFRWNEASLDYRGSNGNYWGLRSANILSSNYLNIGITNLSPTDYGVRGHGVAVRCIAFR